MCSSTYVNETELVQLRPKILTFNRDNHVVEFLNYSVTRDDAEGCCFEILGEWGDVKSVPLRTAELT